MKHEKVKKAMKPAPKTPEKKWLTLAIQLEVPADLSHEDAEERFMQIVDDEDPSTGGEGFWTDSRCDRVQDGQQ